MEPRIQYARTPDGVSIAYYILGEGDVTTIFLNPPTSHLEAGWQIPALRAAFTAAAQDRTFVNIDPRGFGLSDRDVSDLSLDAMVSDIEAVTERIGVRAVGFYTLGFGTPIAVAYAARHPQTTHLVLASTGISAPDFQIPRLIALMTLGAVDWELAAETSIRSFFPAMPEPMRKEFAGLLRAAVDHEQLLRFWDAAGQWDGDEYATRVRARTLLVHDRQDTNADIQITRRVAALIPNAQISFVDGPFQGQRAAREFYNTVLPAALSPSADALAAGTAIILFTDIVNSTALTERLGDERFRSVARTLDERLRAAIQDAQGRPVEGKLLGDGVLATFPSAREAIQAARRCLDLSSEVELPLHIGLHAGDVIREDGNVFGGAVNIAARICDLCAPGEILVSDIVRGLARTSAGVEFEDRGEHALKGVADPQRVFAVRAGPQ
jgi:class 3 adenylate cyclase/pimeloyl-ACP methyl ester carboxylesterase